LENSLFSHKIRVVV